MNVSDNNIDIKESLLNRSGKLLDILLMDHTTKKNIIWATDSYINLGNDYDSKKQIKPELITGKHSHLIRPRASKSIDAQKMRTRDKAEVFTPLKVVDQMNKALDSAVITKSSWQEYVKELKLEITCGEAPFIVSRYNPTAHGVIIKLNNRVGFLDRKLRIVSKYCDNKDEWLFWAKEAFKASYGYEWQGDNLLLARENLLFSLSDYYEAKFKKKPDLKIQEEFAEIISWNIFQMDGIKYVTPMSCKHEILNIPEEWKLFESVPGRVEKRECEGCKYNRPNKHNGKYAKIMDWQKNKVIKFIDLVKGS